MYYAVNLADMTKHKELLSPVMLLVRPVLDADSAPIDCEGAKWDGIGVRVAQEHAESGRFSAIAEIIRKKTHKNYFRIYASKTGNGGWRRI